MVIAFKDNKGCIIAMYPISSIQICCDEEGIPADIEITSKDPVILDTIAEKHCILGYNCQQLMDEDNLVELASGELAYVPQPTGMWDALYGRLQEFVVLPFYKESKEPEYIDW